MRDPGAVKIHEGRLSTARYRAFLLEHLVPGTYWRWTTSSGTIMRVAVLERAEEDIVRGHAIGSWRAKYEPVDDRDMRFHLTEMTPDTGWVLEQITEGEFLCAVLER